MGLNRPFDRPWFVVNGAVKTSGGSANLTKGQLALVDATMTGPNGVQVVSSTAGKQKNLRHFSLRLGSADTGFNRSLDNFSSSTPMFSLNDVVGLRVSVPERTEQSVDELIIGYDGIDPNKAIRFSKGDELFRWTLELEGGGIEWRGGKTWKEVVTVNVEIPNCDPYNNCEDCSECDEVPCRDVITEAIERMKRFQLTGGHEVSKFVDITPVFSCRPAQDEIEYQFYSLSVCDTGTDGALAAVQAQYPDTKVFRVNRSGAISTYQILLPVDLGVPADYEQTIASIIKGCSDCPPGYDPVLGGFLYAFTGTGTASAFQTAVQAISNFSAGTYVLSGTSAGVHYATAIFTEEITEASITSFLTASPGATVNYVGVVQDICENDTVNEVEWEAGEICTVVEEQYEIVLPDTECGEDRLAELQSQYPTLDIAIADSDNSQVTVTLTGSSGTADITVGGDTYVATYSSSLTQTAGNFVTANAAAILADHGLVLTSDGAALIFVGSTEDVTTAAIDIDNATGNLNGVITTAVLPFREACQTKYVATVKSNLVCEECDPVFKDYYITKAPESYDFNRWEAVESEDVNGDCLCGIRVKAKTFVLDAEEALRDQINFVEDSVRIRTAAGYPHWTEIREGTGTLPKGTYAVKYLSRFIPRTHLGGNLRDFENEGFKYSRDRHRTDDYLYRLLTGTVSNIENQRAQYIHYTLTINHGGSEGGFANQTDHVVNWDIFVEVGRHNDVENLLNNIAANAGKPTVQALP
jgi:hypothetical protein